MLPRRSHLVAAACACVAAVSGCKHFNEKPVILPVEGVPRELQKSLLPDYVIEPPDVLQVDLVAAVPRPPYKFQPLDAASINVQNTPMSEPIAGVYQVELDGTVNLGFSYPSVTVAGLTIPEAKAAVEKALAVKLKMAEATVSLAQGRGVQQVRGPHLVRGDGTIGLGTYGAVRVVGLTIPAAKKVIEDYLSTYFQNPEVSLDIVGFNSKVYYLCVDGGSAGTSVTRLPLTGNETVLDALSQIGGLPVTGDPEKVWVARPSLDGPGAMAILPVDWACVTETADARTNYQLMAGDRVFVKAYRAVSFANRFERAFAPVERLLGTVLLGAGTVRSFSNNNNNGGGGGFGGGF